MVRKQTATPVPRSIAPWHRIVGSMPLDGLFTERGLTDHVRGEFLEPEEVAALLASQGELRLAQARIGEALRWYPRGDYGFWREWGKAHAAEPENQRPLEDFPDELCFFISSWVDPADGDQVLLFEEYH